MTQSFKTCAGNSIKRLKPEARSPNRFET